MHNGGGRNGKLPRLLCTLMGKEWQTTSTTMHNSGGRNGKLPRLLCTVVGKEWPTTPTMRYDGYGYRRRAMNTALLEEKVGL